jgi:hypothetical protein
MFKLIKADTMKLYEGGDASPLFLAMALHGVFFVGYVMMLSVFRHYSIK